MKTNLVFIFMVSSIHAICQTDKIIGDWEGTLKGTNLNLVFHIKEESNKLESKMDSPAQGAFGIPCTATVFVKDSLTITLQPLQASYKGNFDKENQTITGSWTQAGQSLSLVLSKKK